MSWAIFILISGMYPIFVINCGTTWQSCRNLNWILTPLTRFHPWKNSRKNQKNYPTIQHIIKYRHYGKLVEKLIEEIRRQEDPEQKRALIVLTANHMKKSFLTWNKDSVEDEQIYNDINTLYGSTLILPEGMTLSNPKDLLQKKSKPSSNKPMNNNKN